MVSHSIWKNVCLQHLLLRFLATQFWRQERPSRPIMPPKSKIAHPLRISNNCNVFLVVKIYNFKLLHTKNLLKIAEVKLSSCGLEVADFRKNCDCGVAVADQQFCKKLRNCNCRSASLKLRSCDCRLKKKLCVPTSGKEFVNRLLTL
jgi:hypothetical protein